jgi:succinate dehydrogenase/fumarate reductase cytochrome b subunit
MVVRSIFDTVRRIPLLRRVRIVLWLLAAAWILHAVLGDKPWELGIQ